MKKQPKIKLSLAKETIAKLNEEQMELIAGGYASGNGSNTILNFDELNNSGAERSSCRRSIWVSKTCPATGTCACICE